MFISSLTLKAPCSPFWQAIRLLCSWFRSHWHLCNVSGPQSGLLLFIRISAVNRQLLLATLPEFEMTTFCVEEASLTLSNEGNALRCNRNVICAHGFVGKCIRWQHKQYPYRLFILFFAMSGADMYEYKSKSIAFDSRHEPTDVPQE
jgi:hypothetical protein